MTKEYYAIATGRKGSASFGLDYISSGIIAYSQRIFAERKLTEVCNKEGIEGKVIDITPLVQKGIISRKKL